MKSYVNKSKFFLENRGKDTDGIWGNAKKQNELFMDAIQKGTVKIKGK